MNSWTVQLTRAAEKELAKLPAKTVQRLRDAVLGLAENPHPRGCKKLVGEEDTYRIRVGEYRIIYEVRDKEVLVLIIRIRHRKDAYR